MRGVVAYGAYVPHHRLRRSEIAAVLGEGGGKGSRAVASYDEDATSIGVEAARRALQRIAPHLLPRRLLFATAAPPYLDKTNASVIHAALSLDANSLAADAVGSMRSGVGALILAAESATPTLLVLSDIRGGLPGSADERDGGDAAAALLFGDGADVIAEVLAQHSVTEEFLDRWRVPGEPASRVWEERFGAFAYGPLADASFAAVLKQLGLAREEIDVLIVAGMHGRAVRAFAKRSGVAQVSDDLSLVVGNAGTAQPGLLLAAALDRAEPNQTIALVVLADGSTAVVFRTTNRLASYQSKYPHASTVATQIASGDETLSYARFLTWRGFLKREPPRRPALEAPAAPSSLRSLSYKYGLIGHRCTQCGTVHLPAVRVCVVCKAIDLMEPIPMSGRIGTVTAFTVDHLAFSPSPPVVVAVVDFDGGGRISCELTDVDPAKLAVGDRVEMTFRKFFVADGIHNYFWKARPVQWGTFSTMEVSE